MYYIKIAILLAYVAYAIYVYSLVLKIEINHYKQKLNTFPIMLWWLFMGLIFSAMWIVTVFLRKVALKIIKWTKGRCCYDCIHHNHCGWANPNHRKCTNPYKIRKTI